MTTMVGGLLAGAVGANAQGAATAAENETLNNWLNHVKPGPMQLSEQERSDAALAACNQGDAASCSTYKSLQATSQQRDADLANACSGGFGSAGCRAQVAAALAGGNDVRPVNGTMYAFDPGAPAIKALPDNYQSIYAGSFDGQIAQSTADALQLAPIELPGAGLLGKIGNWLGLGTGDASRLAAPLATSLDSSTKNLVVAAYGPMNPGPLSQDVANTFRSGTYTEMVAQQPTTLYRVYGGTASELGGYWTQTSPAGPVQSVIDTALLPQWGNSATNVVQIEIPAGTRYFTGAAAPQGGLVGGGNQVVFPQGFRVDPSWIKKP